MFVVLVLGLVVPADVLGIVVKEDELLSPVDEEDELLGLVAVEIAWLC